MSTLAQLNIEVTSAGIVETTAALTSLEDRAKNVQFETLQLNKANITQEQGNKNATKSYELMVLQLARNAEGIAKLKMELQGFTSKQVEHILLLTKEAEAEAYAMEMSKAHYFALREDISRTRTIEEDALKAKVKAEAEGYSYLMEISKAYYQANQEEAKRNAAIQAEIAATTAKRIAEAAKTQQAARTTSAGIFSDESDPLIDKLKARLAMESSIRQRGVDHIRTQELASAQEQTRIRTTLAETLLRLENSIADGTIRSRGQANVMRQGALNLAEREITANNILIESQRAVNAELVQAGLAHSTFHSIAVKSLSIITAMAMYRTLSFLTEIPGQILATNMEMEKLKILLEGITGSVQNANIVFNKLSALDLKTPFDIQALTKSFVQLKNYGLEPTDDVMKALTDQVAKLGGGSEQLIGIGRQLGQAWAKDKLQMIDMRPMIENGLPVISLMAKAIQGTTEEVLAMSAAGTLTRTEMTKLFKVMRDDAPDAALKQMETLHGALSNLTTVWQQFQNVILEDKGEGFLKRVVNDWTGYITILKGLIENGIDPQAELDKVNSKLENLKSSRDKYKLTPGGYADILNKRSEDELLRLQKFWEMEKQLRNNSIADYDEQTAQSAVAKDARLLEETQKQRQVDIKKAEAQSKLEEMKINTTNSNIQLEMDGIKRAADKKIKAFELELQNIKLLGETGRINNTDKEARELSVIEKIRIASVNSLKEQASLQSTMKVAVDDNAEKFWQAFVKMESGGVGRVADVKAKGGEWAMGIGQVLPSTLLNPGHGMKPLHAAVTENLDSFKTDRNKVAEFYKMFPAQIDTFTETYVKQVFAEHKANAAEALKHVGDASKPAKLAEGLNEYNILTGAIIEQNKLKTKGAELTEDISKKEAEATARSAKSVGDRAAYEQNVATASINLMINDRKRLTTDELEEYALDRQRNDEALSEHKISGQQRLVIELELIRKIKEAKLLAIHDEMDLEKKVQSSTKDELVKINAQSKINQLLKDEKIVIGQSKIAEDKAIEKPHLEAAKELDAYNKKLDNTHDKMLKLGTINESVFGGALSGINAMSTGFEKMINTLSTANDKLAENTKMQALNNAQAESPEKIANAQKYADESIKLNQDIVDAKLTGTREMASAVSGMLKKGSDAQKVAHAIEMGIAAWQMTQQAFKIAGYIKEGAIWLSLNATKIFGQIKETALHAASALGFVTLEETKGTAAAATAVAVAAQSSPWTGFITAAAMIAAMAAIGFSLGGGGQSNPHIPESTASANTGTVLGDPTASSESLANVTTVLKDIQAQNYPVLRGIQDGIKGITSGISSTIDTVFKKGGLGNVQAPKSRDMGFQQSMNTAEYWILGGLLMPMLGWLASGLFGGDKSYKVTGQGIGTEKTNLGSVRDSGNVKSFQYANIEEKTSGGWFSDDSYKTTQQKSMVDADTQKAMNRVFKGIGDTMFGLADSLGNNLTKRVNEYIIPAMNIELKGLNGEDAAKKMNTTISTMMDTMVDNIFGDIVGKYQKLGESMLDTTVRIVTQIEVVKDAFKTSGLTFSGDLMGISDALVNAAGGLSEFQTQFTAFFTKFFTPAQQQVVLLDQLKNQLSSVNLTLSINREAYLKQYQAINIATAQGVAQIAMIYNLANAADTYYTAMESNQKTYFNNYSTEQEKLTLKIDTLRTSFARIGLIMPEVNATFNATTGVVTDAKTNYQALLNVLKNDTTKRGQEIYTIALGMSGDFADAATLSATTVKNQLATATTDLGKLYTRQEAIYTLLGNKESALETARSKAALMMDDDTLKYTTAINALSDASTVLTTSQTALETAYKNLTQMRDKFVSLGKGLKDYYNELTGAKNPTASPEQAYNASKKEFMDTSLLAKQGNTEALANLPDVAKSFLEASKQYNSSGDAYQTDYNAVLESLKDGMTAVDKQIEIMNAQLEMARASNTKLLDIDVTTATVNSTMVGVVTALATYNSSLLTYNSASSLAKELLAGIEKLITTKKEDIAATATATAAPGAAIDAANNLASTNASNEAARIAAEQTAAEASKTKAAQERAALLAGYRSSVPTTIAPGGTSNPYWESVIGQFNAEHKARFGVSMNRGWGADADAARQYEALKQQYLASIPAYAMGGIANGLSLVGEQGAELVNFGSPANVTNHSATTGLFDNISKSIRDSSELQAALLKEQVIELQALVNLQSNANVAMIKELKEMKAEIAELTRKAKLEASS